MEEYLSFEELLKRKFASQEKKKPTKAEKKAAEDRDIMRGLCNFVKAETLEYRAFMIGSGKNDIEYLATHAKRAGVDIEIAIEISTPFLNQRFLDLGKETIRMAFELYYPREKESRKYRKYFTKKK